MKEKQCPRWILWVALALLFVNLLIAFSGTFRLVLHYETDQFDGVGAILYCDYGDGYSESDSCYRTIEGEQVTFDLAHYFSIREFRIVPIRSLGTCHITSAEIYYSASCVKQISEAEMTAAFLDDVSTGTLRGGAMVLRNDNTQMSRFYAFSASLIRSAGGVVKAVPVMIGTALLQLVALLAPLAVWYLVKRSLKEKLTKGGLRWEAVALSVLLVVLWLLRDMLTVYWGVALLCVGFAWLGLYRQRHASFVELIAAFVCLCFLPHWMSTASQLLKVTDQGVLRFFRTLTYMIADLALLTILCSTLPEDEESASERLARNFSGELCKLFLYTNIGYYLYYLVKSAVLGGGLAFYAASSSLMSAVGAINITWMFLVVTALYLLVGNGITVTLYVFTSLVIIIGNIIKITYHDSLMTPMDFSQIPDMLRIAPSVLSIWQIILIAAAVVTVVVCCVVFRKHLLAFLKPHLQPLSLAFVLIPTVLLTGMVAREAFSDVLNIGYKSYVSAYTAESTNGMYLYNVYNLMHMSQNAVEKPDDYDEEHMQQVEAELRSYSDREVSDVKPNVICIMAESLFDMDNIQSLSFSEEIEPVIHAHSESGLLSPRFGGYTAAIEYEALTGLSLFFYNDGTMPYTTYYDDAVWSVANEFDASGYCTIAYHPNTGHFYNREKAYELMGFSDVYTIADVKLAEDDKTVGGYCRDTVFAQHVIDMVDASEEPTFLFGVSIAAHYTLADHYLNTDIAVSGEGLSDEEIHILEQQAAAYQESDEMVEMLINYVDQCETPTNLYIFGDHLPPLPMWEKLNYTTDLYQKYGTILIGYSNYQDIIFPQLETPNYLGPQMLLDAEIAHNSYWDYIYDTRSVVPILHREFIQAPVSAEIEERLNIYELIQYDLMFGQKYLLGSAS